MACEELLYTIIKTAIEKGLIYIEDHPKRGVRNLLDLGEYFATSKLQKDFFELAHNILDNEESSYYDMIENIVKEVDHNILINFGFNIGYNSWTNGCKTIRDIEKSENYCVPWTIIFNFNQNANNSMSHEKIRDIIYDGKALGIFSYIFITEKINDYFDIIKENKDCAFILLVDHNRLTDDIVKKIRELSNVFIFVSGLDHADFFSPDFYEKVDLLKKNKCIFGIYTYYDDDNIDYILNGKFAQDIIMLKSTFALLIKDANCKNENINSIYNYVLNSRLNSNLPLFLLDFYKDIERVNMNISSRPCMLSINENGDASISQSSHNILNCSLKQILKTYHIN